MTAVAFFVLSWFLHSSRAFGEVLQAQQVSNGNMVALKKLRIDPTDNDMLAGLAKEVELLRRLQSPFVPSYYNSYLLLEEHQLWVRLRNLVL
jgi:serine/threonine protein kinase